MSNRKKILYVFGGEQASGAEIVMERLIHFNLNNVEPHIFISPGKFASNLMASGKPYKVVPVEQLRKLQRSSTGKLLFYAKAIGNHFSISQKVLRYARANGIHCIHAVTVVPATYCLPGIFFSRLSGKKIKWMWSDYDIRHFARLDHYFAAACGKMYNITLAASDAVKRKYGNRPTVHTLYNGLDPEVFKPDADARLRFRQSLGFADNEIVFGLAGVISPRKGQLGLIKAFGEAVKKHSNIRLVLAGSLGPDFPTYNEQIVQLAKQDPRIHYVGHYNDMMAMLNGCDVIVNNSTAEGSEPLGTTIYEAMSCETLAIASNTGGSPEIIEDGVDGLLFEPDNELSLKATIEKIASTYGDLHALRKAGRKKVQQKFSYQQMIARYNDL